MQKENTPLNAHSVWSFIHNFYNLEMALSKRSIINNWLHLRYFSGAEYFVMSVSNEIKKEFDISNISEIVDHKKEEFSAYKNKYQRINNLCKHVIDIKNNTKLSNVFIRCALIEALKHYHSYAEFNTKLTDFLSYYGYIFDKNKSSLLKTNYQYDTNLLSGFINFCEESKDTRLNKSSVFAQEAIACIKAKKNYSAIKAIKEMNFYCLQFVCARYGKVFDFFDYQEMIAYICSHTKNPISLSLMNNQLLNMFDISFEIINKNDSLSEQEKEAFKKSLDASVEVPCLFEISLALCKHLAHAACTRTTNT